MVELIQRAKRVGGSIMVRIPKDAVELEQIADGDLIRFEPKKVRRDVFGSLPDVGPFTQEDKFDARD